MAAKLRVFILLTILAIVAGSAYLTKARLHSWKRPLVVAVHPVIAEPETAAFAQDWRALDGLDAFFDNRVQFLLQPASARVPPMRPGEGAPWYDIVLYSLRLRAWAFRDKPKADCRVYVLFHNSTVGRVLEHSGSVPEARLGVVYTFADKRSDGQTRVAIAHELLHTLGATDKDDGAEIMSGKLGDRLIDDLQESHIGVKTRQEVGLPATNTASSR